MRSGLIALALFALPLSCTGTTGYQLVSFYAVARGTPEAKPGQPLKFDTDRGFHVSLTKATLRVGALYLNESEPVAGSAEQSCTLPGTYVGEVRGGKTFDMLDPADQLFPVAGDGSNIPSLIGEVWLTSGDVYATTDPTIILSIAGTASDDNGNSWPFAGDITIDKSRGGTTSTALPGSNPICKQRIVSKIPAELTLSQGGTLVLNLDPKVLFTNVDFTTLKQFSSDPPSFGFSNDDTTQANRNLYENLHAAGAVYRFEWQPAAP